MLSMPSKMMPLPLLSCQTWVGGVPPARSTKVGHQSMWHMISLATVPGLMWPGHQAMAGTRKPPSKLRPLRAAEGRVAGVGPRVDPRAVVRGPDDQRVLGDARVADRLQDLAGVVVQLHQGVEVVAAAGRFSLEARRRVVGVVHLHEAEVHEEGLVVLGVRLDVLDRVGAHDVVGGRPDRRSRTSSWWLPGAARPCRPIR